MTRRRLLKGGSAAALITCWALGVSFSAAPPSARKPNIILFVADDLGWGHLGAYGQKIIRTPNIDRLAAEGVRFTQAYAGASVCAPSRSVLLTGLHAGHTPVRGNSGGIPLGPQDMTVADILKRAGYATGGFGKWGLGDAGTSGIPTRHGFDRFFGYLHQKHAHFYYPEYLWNGEQRWPLPKNMVGGRLPGDADGWRTQYAPDETLAQALDFIRANRDRPFFCYIPTTIPHEELIAPPESMQPYTGRFMEARFDDPRPGQFDNPAPKAAMAAMISYMDRNVGKLLALLKDLDIDEDTLFIFTSDNGPRAPEGDDYVGYPTGFFNAAGPLRGYKGTLYEGGIRVPAIMRWPGKLRPRSDDLVWYFADLFPTLADIVGVTYPNHLDGVSFARRLLDGESPVPARDLLYWEHRTAERLQQAVRMGRWKGLRSRPGAALELYDLEDDIAERKNVVAAHPDIVRRIEECFRDCRTVPRPQIEPDKPFGQLYR